MPLSARMFFLGSIMFAASLAAAQPLQSFRHSSIGPKNSVSVRDLSLTTANSDTVVTSWASSRVTLGLRLLNKVDSGLIDQFRKAWAISKAGFDRAEGVVIVFLMSDGSYVGRSPGITNEFEQASFKLAPAAVAIVHTHPNGVSPSPSRIDQATADSRGIPVFTITSQGMFVYNPTIRETAKVMDRLDWLQPSKWAERSLKHPTLVDEYTDLGYHQ